MRASRSILPVLLAAAAGCRGEPAPPPLVVADVRQPATSLVFVALEGGCAARERLKVEERTFDLGRDALALLREGRADVAVVYETPLLRAAFEDDRLRVLTTLHTSTRNTRIVARGERGVASFSDLRGKRVGVAAGTNADFFIDLALRSGGVEREAVTVVNLDPDASVQALASGALDAAVLSDPPAARAEEALGPSARVVHTDLYVEMSLLVTRTDVLATRGSSLRALVRALSCAERATLERPDAALAHTRARFPGVDGRALEAQLARVQRRLGLDHVLLHVLRDEGEWLRGAGLARGTPPDPTALVERSVLVDADPEAVMLLPRRVLP